MISNSPLYYFGGRSETFKYSNILLMYFTIFKETYFGNRKVMDRYIIIICSDKTYIIQ